MSWTAAFLLALMVVYSLWMIRHFYLIFTRALKIPRALMGALEIPNQVKPRFGELLVGDEKSAEYIAKTVFFLHIRSLILRAAAEGKTEIKVDTRYEEKIYSEKLKIYLQRFSFVVEYDTDELFISWEDVK